MIQWRKFNLSSHVNGEKNYGFFKRGTTKGEFVTVIYAGKFISEYASSQEICHWVIACTKGKKFYEPSYKEKLNIVKEIGKWGNIALEVMPSERKVVDEADIYHIWEFQYPYSFIYNISPIFEKPDVFEEKFENIKYHVEDVKGVQYIYFKSTSLNPIGWKKKQQLKNFILGEDAVAVEFILEGMGGDYACMVALKKGETLDFGLVSHFQAPPFEFYYQN